MSENTKHKIKILFVALLYIVLGILFLREMSYSLLVWAFSDLIHELWQLRLSFYVVFISAIVFSVIVFKKYKTVFKRHITIIVILVSSFVINCLIYSATIQYYSVFTREKWDNHIKIRSYMIDDLEEKYDFVGMTEKDVMNILGEPTTVLEDKNRTIMYMIGTAVIDPYMYIIEFENGFVIKTHTASYG